VSHDLGLICGIAVAIAVNGVAQARDFEMGGDSSYRYSIAAPASNAAIHHAAAGSSRTRHATPQSPLETGKELPPFWRCDYDKK
jgi:hypothetical protein